MFGNLTIPAANSHAAWTVLDSAFSVFSIAVTVAAIAAGTFAYAAFFAAGAAVAAAAGAAPAFARKRERTFWRYKYALNTLGKLVAEHEFVREID